MKTGTQGKCLKDKMLSEPTDETAAFSLSALPTNKHETDSFKHDHSKQTMGEFILSVADGSPGFQAILMQRRFLWLLSSSVEESNSFALGANDEMDGGWIYFKYSFTSFIIGLKQIDICTMPSSRVGGNEKGVALLRIISSQNEIVFCTFLYAKEKYPKKGGRRSFSGTGLFGCPRITTRP
jgi:hypothetical protein